MLRTPALALFAWALLMRGPACAAQGEPDPPAERRFDLQLAFEQSRGDYGDPFATRIRATTLVGRYRGEKWSAAIEVPWLDVRSAGGGAALPGTVGEGSSSVERGLGDIWLRLSTELREFSAKGVGLDLTLKVKTATGSLDRGLGSGGTDVALQLEGLKALGAWTGFGHVGWRRTGDVAGFRPYRDPWYVEFGGLTALTPSVEAGAYWSGRQAIGRLGPVRELTLYGAWRGGSQRLQLYVTRGFATASAQYAVGVAVRHRF
jgi:hypothetical protein